jgi:hypothetical protein
VLARAVRGARREAQSTLNFKARNEGFKACVNKCEMGENAFKGKVPRLCELFVYSGLYQRLKAANETGKRQGLD